MAMKRMPLLIPEELLERIDRAAAAAHLNRSTWIRIMLRDLLDRTETTETLTNIGGDAFVIKRDPR